MPRRALLARMPRPNVGERDARVRQLLGGAGILLAASTFRKHPILASAATIAAVDLLATAAARWCWTLELLDVDTRQLDVGPSRLGAPTLPARPSLAA